LLAANNANDNMLGIKENTIINDTIFLL